MKAIIFVVLFFVVMTALFTFPLVSKVNSYISGFFSTDEPYAALSYLSWLRYAHSHHLNPTHISVIAAPFGQAFDPGFVYWNLIHRTLAVSTGIVFAYNIQILLSFLLTGIMTYLLAVYIFHNRAAALFSALLFTFCPYHAVRSWQHLGLAQTQWMPLYLWAFLLLRKTRRLGAVLFVAIAFTLVMSFDLYYAYFMSILTVLFILFDFFYSRNAKATFGLLKAFFLAVFFILIFESFDIYHIFKFIRNTHISNMAHGVLGYIRPFEDLFSQSARPLSYVLPASTHPLYGWITEQFVGSSWYGGSFTEHTLYLGWTAIILALLACRIWLKKRKKSAVTHGGITSADDFYYAFFIVLAISAWLLSQPAWWTVGPLKIYMPSFFLYKLFPMFRAYCRFGIVVMLAVAVLAGFGLKYILERCKTQKAKIAITCLFSCLALFEFWNWPPYKVIDVSKVPAAYYWLKEQPGDFAVAEYPLDVDSTNEIYKFCQTVHEKKIINGTMPGTYANKVAQTIRKLSRLETARALKWMGVKYVLVHQQDYKDTTFVDDSEELNKIPQNAGLKFIKSFSSQGCPQEDIMCVQKTGPIDVYEIVALPIEPKASK